MRSRGSSKYHRARGEVLYEAGRRLRKRAGMSLDEDERLRSDAEAEGFLKSGRARELTS
jgi:hypothetical protein